MRIDLSGKNALITGSTKGIGRAIAMVLAKEGARIVVHGKSEKSVSATLKDFKKESFDVLGIAGDLTSLKTPGTIAQFIRKKLGKIDILVNNAGIYTYQSIEKITLEDWQNIININLTSTFLLIREFLPLMKNQKHGRIINITSVAGISGRKLGPHYNAAKGGMIAMTQGLAKDLGKYSITVNCIAPGLIQTENVMKSLNSVNFDFKNLQEVTPLKRLGMPEDIASVALFLTSPLADFITGETIIVNGGAPLSF